LIFIHVIDDAFTVNGEPVVLSILKDAYPGKNFYLAEIGTLESSEISWEVVRRITRYGGGNMNCSKACVVWRMCKEVKHVSWCFTASFIRRYCDEKFSTERRYEC
jgi:hypothetical protein